MLLRGCSEVGGRECFRTSAAECINVSNVFKMYQTVVFNIRVYVHSTVFIINLISQDKLRKGFGFSQHFSVNYHHFQSWWKNAREVPVNLVTILSQGSYGMNTAFYICLGATEGSIWIGSTCETKDHTVTFLNTALYGSVPEYLQFTKRWYMYFKNNICL